MKITLHLPYSLSMRLQIDPLEIPPIPFSMNPDIRYVQYGCVGKFADSNP
jgi:hypothetical protein